KGKGFLVRASGGKDVAMAMIGKWYVVENRVGGVSGFESLDSKSGIRFWDPFICLTEKSYLENQSFNRSNIFSGTVLPLKLRMLGKAELSIWMRKWWPMRWYSNFLMPCFTAKISLNTLW
ncbi:hypothetical protein CEJ84_20100, partial [Acinetobacter baumannii]